MVEQARIIALSAADRIVELLTDAARRFDEAIPGKEPISELEEIGATGLHHLVRHYENILAWLTDEPDQVSLDHYGEEEIRGLAFYAARTGRVEALDQIIDRTGFDTAARDEQGLTLLDHAQRDRQYAVVHYLINRGV